MWCRSNSTRCHATSKNDRRSIIILLILALSCGLAAVVNGMPAHHSSGGGGDAGMTCLRGENGECIDEGHIEGFHHAGGKRSLDVGSRPLTPKLGDVMENLGNKVPEELPGWMNQTWGKIKSSSFMTRVQEMTAPHVQKLVTYGGEVLRPGEELAARCRGRSKKVGSGRSRGGGNNNPEPGLDACSLLEVSWSLGRQLANVGKNASAATASWLAQEVPRVPIPLYLIWVEVDVDVSPVSGRDVGSIILHQRPYWIVTLADWVSERLVRFFHSIPFFDLLINARYDLFYWPDPACPLTQIDGIVTRAPLTSDGYCEVRPCALQSSVLGQYAKDNPFCECNLPEKHCRLRAEPLRDFNLLLDEGLATKKLEANCVTKIAWSNVPHWFPVGLRSVLEGIIPRYLFNLIVGLFLVWAAEPLSESRLIHLLLSGVMGLFSGLIVVALTLNYTLRTVRRLQPFSGLATFVSSAAMILLFQRFGRESPITLTLQLLQILWADPKGQWLIIGSFFLGIMMTFFMGWFKESEDEARERGGWLRLAMNGQANIHKLCRYAGLYALLHSCPNPDYGALVIILFLISDQLYYLAYRTHMYIHRSPDTTRYVSCASYYAQARVGDDDDYDVGKPNRHTEQALNDLRDYVRQNPNAAHALSDRGNVALNRFRDGESHVSKVAQDEYKNMGQGNRSGCCVQ